jgi:hypothetical protein
MFETQTLNPALRDAVKEAWRGGYQTATEAVRDMADDFEDAQVRKAIHMIVKSLKMMRP